MALIAVLLGSVLGFFGALAGWLFFDVTLLASLAIWMLSGPATAIVVSVPLLLARSGGESLPETA